MNGRRIAAVAVLAVAACEHSKSEGGAEVGQADQALFTGCVSVCPDTENCFFAGSGGSDPVTCGPSETCTYQRPWCCQHVWCAEQQAWEYRIAGAGSGCNGAKTCVRCPQGEFRDLSDPSQCCRPEPNPCGGVRCGMVADSCGYPQSCGSCQSGFTCENNTCIQDTPPPPPPSCRGIGATCATGGDCCSNTCWCGQCAVSAGSSCN